MGQSEKQSLLSKLSIIGGLVGGLVHTALAVVLWNYFGLDSLRELFLTKPVYGMYIFLGMFALGFIPALFYFGKKFISPALVVTLLLLVTGVGSWQAGPVQAPVGGPTPFGIYILFWVLIVALAGLISRVERLLNQ